MNLQNPPKIHFEIFNRAWTDMKRITYKGYVGEYEEYNDGLNATTYYAGSIPAVKQYAMVLFEGESMEQMVNDFHAAVEDCIRNGYICKEKPRRITIPATLYSQLSARAKQNGQSVSLFVERILTSCIL